MGERARRSISNYTHSLGFAIHDFANPSYFPVYFVFECSRGAEYLPIFRFEICLLRTPHFGNQVEEFFSVHTAVLCIYFCLSWEIICIYLLAGKFHRCGAVFDREFSADERR